MEKKTEELDLDYELKILWAMKSKIKGNPLCHRSGCHGSGFLGIKIGMVDGVRKPLLWTCECVQFGETEYQRLYDKIVAEQNVLELLTGQINEFSARWVNDLVQHDAKMNNIFLTISEDMLKLHYHRSLSGFIIWKLSEAWKFIRRWWYAKKGGIVS